MEVCNLLEFTWEVGMLQGGEGVLTGDEGKPQEARK